MSFDSALTFVLAREGGYVNNPADPGGATNQGVTQRVFDLWQSEHNLPVADVAHIPVETVAAIYKEHYWLASNADVLPDGPALALFDTAVNLGLQRALALWAQANGNVEEFLWLRLQHYDDLARGSEPLRQFLPGWVRRLILLREAVR